MKRYFLYFAALAILLSGCAATESIIQAEPMPIEAVSPTVPDSTIVLQGTAYLPSGEPLLFGSIAAYQNDILLRGTEAGFDGRYTLMLPPNTGLTLNVLYVGYESAIYQLHPLSPGSYKLDLSLTTPKEITEGLYCPSYRIPLIDLTNTSSGAIYNSSDLKKSPNFPGGL